MESGLDPRILDGTALSPREVGERACRGDLLVVRGCLQRLGLLGALRSDALGALAAVVGAERAGRIEVAGEPTEVAALLGTGLPAPGMIRAIDERTCATRLPDGRAFAFERFCSHEGGDLAAATLRDGEIVCPGHGTPFEAATGRSGCPGVRALKVCALA